MSWHNVRNISNSCRVKSKILICFTRKAEHATSSVSSLHTGHNKSLRIIAFLYLHLCTDIGDIPNLNLSFRETELQNVYILLCLDTLFENRIKFKAFFSTDTSSRVLPEPIQQSLFQNRHKSVQMSYILYSQISAKKPFLHSRSLTWQAQVFLHGSCSYCDMFYTVVKCRNTYRVYENQYLCQCTPLHTDTSASAHQVQSYRHRHRMD